MICTHFPVSVLGVVSSACPFRLRLARCSWVPGAPDPNRRVHSGSRTAQNPAHSGSASLIPVAVLPPKYSGGTRT